MPTPSIETLYDDLFARASEIVATGEEHQPFLVVLKDGNEVGIMSLVDLPTETISSMHRVAADHFAAAILITEVWTVEFARNEAKLDENGEYVGPPASEHPNRTEAILFNVLTPTRQAMAFCPIDRSTRTLGKRPLNWLDELPEGQRIGGRLVREDGPLAN